MTFLAIEKYEFIYISAYICHFMQCEENTSTYSIRCLFIINNIGGPGVEHQEYFIIRTIFNKALWQILYIK